jgi:uncharacterized membrane protein
MEILCFDCNGYFAKALGKFYLNMILLLMQLLSLTSALSTLYLLIIKTPCPLDGVTSLALFMVRMSRRVLQMVSKFRSRLLEPSLRPMLPIMVIFF